MIAMAGCVFYFYYKAGKFNNITGELHNRLEDEHHAGPNKKTERLDSGKWFTNKLEMYHTLSFETGNKITIDNHVDTLFHYLCKLSNDTLWLLTDGKHLIPNKIKLHNKDELVFENFLGAKNELRYVRINSMEK